MLENIFWKPNRNPSTHNTLSTKGWCQCHFSTIIAQWIRNNQNYRVLMYSLMLAEQAVEQPSCRLFSNTMMLMWRYCNVCRGKSTGAWSLESILRCMMESLSHCVIKDTKRRLHIGLVHAILGTFQVISTTYTFRVDSICYVSLITWHFHEKWNILGCIYRSWRVYDLHLNSLVGIWVKSDVYRPAVRFKTVSWNHQFGP